VSQFGYRLSDYLHINIDAPWIYIADSCPQSRAAPPMQTQ